MRSLAAIATAISCALVVFVWSSALQSKDAGAPPGTADLNQLLRDRRYLELDTALASKSNLSVSDRTFFDGVMANRRNRVADSIRMLEPLVPSLSSGDKERAVMTLSTLADDYEKSFRYSDAANTYDELERRFGLLMDESERQRATREAARWNLLRGSPPQSVEVKEPFTIPTRKDRVGLPEVWVDFGKFHESLILDTGANLSAISVSLAQRLGLKLSNSTATSRGIAGRRMAIRTAVIPELRLGEAKIKSVAVIVIDDKDLVVPSLHYLIPGSIGFPVLSALGRITFFADGRFGVGLSPATGTSGGEENLFLQRLMPVVAAEVEGTERLFTIDTGSAGTFFTMQYYLEHRSDFASRTIGSFDLAGAGGVRSYPAYLTGKVNIKMGGACVSLNQLPVITQPRAHSEDKFYGNIGQLVLGRLKSYTFDFQKMNFSAEGDTCKPGEQK
ncbi:MAG: retropepsin-like aspartic protease [Terriglobales bacterium]